MEVTKDEEPEVVEIRFKFQLDSIVCAKPFVNQGRTIIPPAMERYKVLARGYQEGIRPGTKIIDNAIIYHVKLQGIMFKDSKKISVIKETDLNKWVDPTKNDDLQKGERASGIVL